MSRSSGLRNRYRNGQGSYSRNGKGRYADKYGTYRYGKIITNESIAGCVISSDLPSVNLV